MKLRLPTFLLITVFFLSNNLNAQINTQWGPDGFVKIENGLAGVRVQYC